MLPQCCPNGHLDPHPAEATYISMVLSEVQGQFAVPSPQDDGRRHIDRLELHSAIAPVSDSPSSGETGSHLNCNSCLYFHMQLRATRLARKD